MKKFLIDKLVSQLFGDQFALLAILVPKDLGALMHFGMALNAVYSGGQSTVHGGATVELCIANAQTAWETLNG